MLSYHRVAPVTSFVSLRSLSLVCLVVFSVVACSTLRATAQTSGGPPYEGLPVEFKMPGDEKAIKNAQMVANSVLRGSLRLTDQAAVFDSYYKKYVFWSFTQPDQVDKLWKTRQGVSKAFRTPRMAPAVHNHLLNLTFAYMKNLVTYDKLNFHPAVRVNAMLLIGDLNEVEASTTNKVAKPLPQALDFMLTEYDNPKQPDNVRIAALIGILRHVKSSLAPPNQPLPRPMISRIAKPMLLLVQAKDPPANRSPEGHVWMQRRAIEVLAALGGVGAPTVNQALDQYLSDADAAMSLRCTAAAALESARSAENLDLVNMSLKLGSLAVFICQREMERIEELEQEESRRDAIASGRFTPAPTISLATANSGGMNAMDYDMMQDDMGDDEGQEEDMDYDGMEGMEGMEGMGGMGGGYSVVQVESDPKVDRARRRIKYQLVCVQAGLDGLARLATAGPQKTKVQQIVDQVAAVMDATDPTEEQPVLSLEMLVEALTEATQDLQRITQTAPVVASSAPGKSAPDVPAKTPDIPGGTPPATADVPAAAVAPGKP